MGVQKSRLKLTSSKEDFEFEAKLGKIECSYWVSFALSFSSRELYFLVRWVGWMVGESEDKDKLNLSCS